MPVEENHRPSLAYRTHHDDIWNGVVPAKYTRLLPFIKGHRALELGSAEGVLALLLARDHKLEHVTGLELRADRHHESLELQRRWRALGFQVERAQLLCGDIREQLHLLDSVDTLICVRSIYYLREHAPAVIARAGAGTVRRIVLCGNRGRQQQHRADPQSDLGVFNRLASIEGMRELLERGGYRIDTFLDEGDPIVVGVKP